MEPEQVVVNQDTPSNKQSSNPITPILIIILLLAVIGLAVWFVLQVKGLTPSSAPQETILEQPTFTPSYTPLPTLSPTTFVFPNQSTSPTPTPVPTLSPAATSTPRTSTQPQSNIY